MMLRLFIFLSALVMAYPAFAESRMRVVVPNRDIARGETIGEGDLMYGTIEANTVFSGIVTSVDQLKGMEARRLLHAGEVVRTDDVRHPIVVTKGAIVTMTFEAPGIVLTASGRALSEGGIGDTVTVQNPASFRQVSAVVTGPGTVRTLNSALAVPGSAHLALAH
ncbi:MAG TPA: flagellar basal body P-ring formation chaperone FlgA [Rhizomicrobium sp.]|nr:flagellar basal body P-ring formation chaperone FlgA [Rhizomicrobium sp.]